MLKLFKGFFKSKHQLGKGVTVEIVKGLDGQSLAIVRVDVGYMPQAVAEKYMRSAVDIEKIKPILGVDLVWVVGVNKS